MSELPIEREVVELRQRLAQVTQERDAAETRNENYRLKLHERDTQLAAMMKETIHLTKEDS